MYHQNLNCSLDTVGDTPRRARVLVLHAHAHLPQAFDPFLACDKSLSLSLDRSIERSRVVSPGNDDRVVVLKRATLDQKLVF